MEAQDCLTACQIDSQLLGLLFKGLCALTSANLSHFFPPKSHTCDVWLSKWNSTLPPAYLYCCWASMGSSLQFLFFILKLSTFFTNPVHVTLWWALDLSPTRSHFCLTCSPMVHCCIFTLALILCYTEIVFAFPLLNVNVRCWRSIVSHWPWCPACGWAQDLSGRHAGEEGGWRSWHSQIIGSGRKVSDLNNLNPTEVILGKNVEVLGQP